MNLSHVLLGLTLLLPAGFVAAAEHAHEHHGNQPAAASASIHVADAWSRAMPPVAPTAAVYLTLHNAGADDRLLGARSAQAGRIEIHEHVEVDGAMRMRQREALELPSGGLLKLEPMGNHLMLFDLPRQAADGEQFEVTLIFEKAGELPVQVSVRRDAPAGQEPAGQHHHH